VERRVAEWRDVRSRCGEVTLAKPEVLDPFLEIEPESGARSARRAGLDVASSRAPAGAS
jgi:hypothetical protein